MERSIWRTTSCNRTSVPSAVRWTSSSASAFSVIFSCGICTCTWKPMPVFGSGQKIGTMKRLEDVAASTESPTPRTLPPLRPSLLRLSVMSKLG